MLFVQDQYCYLVKDLSSVESFTVQLFENQECQLTLNRSVAGKDCVIVGSLTAAFEQQLSLLQLCHVLKKSGATKIILFSPYLGYQRQDKIKIDCLQGLVWADAMLKASGVDVVQTIEPHHQQSLTTLQIPVFAHSAQFLFQKAMARFVDAGFGFVFPDAGARARYVWIQELFPQTAQGVFMKHRMHGMVQLQGFSGKIGRKVIVYDDILDSGTTLVQVCIALRQLGVEEIVIFVTHAFFHGSAWCDLWSLGVKALYCSNSLPAADQIEHPRIHVQSIQEILKKSI